MLSEPSESVVEDIILEELVRGYHLNGRVLRHAQVKVSMGPGPKEDLQEKKLGAENQTGNDDSSESTDSLDRCNVVISTFPMFILFKS